MSPCCESAQRAPQPRAGDWHAGSSLPGFGLYTPCRARHPGSPGKASSRGSTSAGAWAAGYSASPWSLRLRGHFEEPPWDRTWVGPTWTSSRQQGGWWGWVAGMGASGKQGGMGREQRCGEDQKHKCGARRGRKAEEEGEVGLRRERKETQGQKERTRKTPEAEQRPRPACLAAPLPFQAPMASGPNKAGLQSFTCGKHLTLL